MFGVYFLFNMSIIPELPPGRGEESNLFHVGVYGSSGVENSISEVLAMSNQKFGKGILGKGYYLALILCAVAIGISGYLYYTGLQEEPPAGEDTPAGVTDPVVDATLGVVGTQPVSEDVTPTLPVKDPVITTQPIQTVFPVEGQVVAVYAMDHLGYNPTTRDWRVHNGMDIAAQEGTKVCAAAGGTVYTVYEDDTMGHTVVIRHENGYVTSYSSLSEEILVGPGDEVRAGQELGTVGVSALLESAIGPHVHFCVTVDDQPVDPAEFLTPTE